MPSIKEKCVCQICICGKHHCGEEIKFPSLIEEPERERTEEEDFRHRLVGVTQGRSDLSHKLQNEKEKLTDSELIEGDTQSGHLESSGDQSRQRIVTITLTRSQRQTKANKEEIADLPEHWTEMKGTNEQDGEPSGLQTGADNVPSNDAAEAEAVTIKTSQRKTWQTSPEQVEELTRSLSRMRTDHEHGGYLYEKMIEKEKSQTLNRLAKDKPPKLEKASGKAAHLSQPSFDQPQLLNCNGQQHYASAAKMGKGERKKSCSQKESFLPPLTGFSDSDSSFGSFSCSVEGDHHLPMDRQIQCICESMKKTKLEEHESMPFGADSNIKFINVDDNWIVTRPARVKPRDNLRLEGPMEMETTFRSTYETAAQRMIERGDSQESLKSKRSTATTSRTNKGSPQLYLNTRRGRTGATPLLRSAKKRRNARHRPMTSLKAGGDGYYNTISRDAYKNFIIVNGEAKMVGDQVKLPKVMSKTIEEKNRQKYMKSKSTKKCTDSKRCKNGDDKMVMIGGEEIRKFEKKSYITKSDGAEEVTDMERKIVRKVKCAPKDETTNYKDNDPAESSGNAQEGDKVADEQQQKQPSSYTMDNITGAPKRPFHTRYQDNIKELGLLDRNEETLVSPTTENYRHHMRRLHETSKDFDLKLPESPLPEEKAKHTRGKGRLEAMNKPPSQPVQPPKSKVVNGHAMSKPSHKPFILPQRIQRHKNECSVNVFEGDMDFTTTNHSAYGETTSSRKLRVGSAQRKRTAGRRSLKSSKRRNLFRQSSDSMFSASDNVAQDHHEVVIQSKSNPETAGATEHQAPKFTSTYKKQFDDRLYCPALDVDNTGENFKYTGEAGGHKYYLSSNYS